jgi:hypothetical protein
MFGNSASVQSCVSWVDGILLYFVKTWIGLKWLRIMFEVIFAGEIGFGLSNHFCGGGDVHT